MTFRKRVARVYWSDPGSALSRPVDQRHWEAAARKKSDNLSIYKIKVFQIFGVKIN
jgi:hypothetical protein